MESYRGRDYSSSENLSKKLRDDFFRSFIEGTQPGRILLPADGYQNAKFATRRGWDVDLYDFCFNARKKSIENPGMKGSKKDHFPADIEFHELEEDMYDVIALIHVRLERKKRAYIHSKLISFLKSGGYFLIESDDGCDGQEEGNSYDIDGLRHDFSALEIEILTSTGRDPETINENMRDIIRMVARKP